MAALRAAAALPKQWLDQGSKGAPLCRLRAVALPVQSRAALLAENAGLRSLFQGTVGDAQKHCALLPGNPVHKQSPVIPNSTVTVQSFGLRRNKCSSWAFQKDGAASIRTYALACEADTQQTAVLQSGVASSDKEYVVVNFYHFVELEDPLAEVERQASFMKEHDFRGRIFINHQGINAQFSCLKSEALAYREWLQQDPRFQEVLIQVAAAPQHAFPRLKLRYKPDLVMVKGGTRHLPITEKNARAVPLSPTEWRQKLDQAGSQQTGIREQRSGQDEAGSERSTVLLDVRNGYEWDVGHFQGAERPEVDCFRETEFGLSEGQEPRDPLAGVDPEKTDVLMYCTGGIRCDVYSTMLRKQGFQSLYTLQGGIVNYLKEEGPRHWNGNLFVFDSRLSVHPKEISLEASAKAISAAEALETDHRSSSHEEATTSASVASLPWTSCKICGAAATEKRHRNCANADCNELFLCCPECAGSHRGCCCTECAAGPRLRPFLPEAGQYERLYNYEIGRRVSEAKLSKRAEKRRQWASKRHARRLIDEAKRRETLDQDIPHEHWKERGDLTLASQSA